MPREIPSTTESSEANLSKSENLDLIKVRSEAQTNNNNHHQNSNRFGANLANKIADLGSTATDSSHRNLSSGFGRAIPTLQEMQERGETLVADRKGRRLLRKLFDGGKGRLLDRQNPDKRKESNKDFRTEKIEFPQNDSYGMIKELHLPQGFKDTGNGDNFQRIYTNNKSMSRISYMNATELNDNAKTSLEQLLANHDGVLKPESPESLAAATIIGGGYHPFSNKPQISINTLDGKKVIVLSDISEQFRLAGHTVFVPSEDLSSLYSISFAGAITDLEAVKAGLKKTKWQQNK